MDYQTCRLSNGIRLIHKTVSSPVAHCGIIINAGSRDEEDEVSGMAHFVEHMLFKGTSKRKAYHILSRMEDVGGELNAYTTKEETCLHATFFSNYYPRAFELIADVIFNSSFPEKEIEKEKDVVIDEINSYKDSPFELIFDDFEEYTFKGHPLGNNILGSKKTITQFNRGAIQDFVHKNYATTETVISSVSSAPFKTIEKHFRKHFENIAANDQILIRKAYAPDSYQPFSKEFEKDTHQSHCLIGNTAYSLKDEKRLSLYLLNNLLGGPGLNSKLTMELREKRGLAYNVESNFTTFSDTGVFNIYFGTDNKHLNTCTNTVLRELKKLRENKLGTLQLSKAKKQVLGQIAISAENNESQMLSYGKSLLVFNKVDSLAVIKKKIESIQAEQVLEVANEIFAPDKLSYLIYK